MDRVPPVWVLLSCIVALIGCSAPQPTPPPTPITSEITVFAAASLSESFRAIGAQFEQANPEVRVIFNFAGSQQLAAQIGQGAPVDLFASANQSQMQVVIDAGMVEAPQVQVFASNQLVVVVSPTSQVPINILADLAAPGAKIILADASVPAGQYARQFLQQAANDPAYGPAFEQAVLAHVVSYEENVRNVLSKVGLGEADAGIVYTSDAVTQPQLRQIAIPNALNVQARYPIAVLRESKQRAHAERFMAFVLSERGQQILANAGFGAP